MRVTANCLQNGSPAQRFRGIPADAAGDFSASCRILRGAVQGPLYLRRVDTVL